MKTQPSNPTLRSIPSVDRLLEEARVLNLVAQTSRAFVVSLLRKVLNTFRQHLISGIAKDSTGSDPIPRLLAALEAEFQQWTAPQLLRVINATGVILHTNLGRAPISPRALQNLIQVSGNYSNLEFNLDEGIRGKRDTFADRLFRELLGCEQAIVVNNCAAALFLALNTLAEGAEVLISRGELIEIGDSFRIPDILRKSGTTLREVGTTNKTRLSDYASAFTERTRLILRVHPSNFRMVGFTSRPPLEELLKLCKERSLPLMEDLGSGCFVDLRPLGIEDEPNPRASLAAGVPLTCFSGDKLLGGPQAGILAGQADLIARLRSNPLFRALRVDKLTLAVLESTLISYLKHREAEEIPLMRMIHESHEDIRRRAEAVLARIEFPVGIKAEIVEGCSMIGGGSTPDHGIASRLISLSGPRFSSQEMESRLRRGNPPVLCRIESDSLLLDLRTVFPEDDTEVAGVLSRSFPASR